MNTSDLTPLTPNPDPRVFLADLATGLFFSMVPIDFLKCFSEGFEKVSKSARIFCFYFPENHRKIQENQETDPGDHEESEISWISRIFMKSAMIFSLQKPR